MNKYDAEAEALRLAVEKVKQNPGGMDLPVQTYLQMPEQL